MSEYGQQMSLEEILQSLVAYCCSQTVEDVNIKIALPKNVIHKFSSLYKLKSIEDKTNGEKLDMTQFQISPINISKLYLTGGTVEFI